KAPRLSASPVDAWKSACSRTISSSSLPTRTRARALQPALLRLAAARQPAVRLRRVHRQQPRPVPRQHLNRRRLLNSSRHKASPLNSNSATAIRTYKASRESEGLFSCASDRDTFSGDLPSSRPLSSTLDASS